MDGSVSYGSGMSGDSSALAGAYSRGRGRGRGIFLPESPESKPGKSNAPLLEELTSLVGSLAVDASDDQLNAVRERIEKLTTTPDALSDIAHVVLSRCEQEWRFAKCAGRLCSNLMALAVDNVTFRTVMLTNLQAHYKECNREQSQTKYLGCLSLLCQLLTVVKFPGGFPPPVFCAIVLSALEACLSCKPPPDEEVDCISVQMLDVGDIVQKHSETAAVARVRNMIKDRVADGCGSRETRVRLIQAIEGFASHWQWRDGTA